jgi:hypothetical protein
MSLGDEVETQMRESVVHSFLPPCTMISVKCTLSTGLRILLLNTNYFIQYILTYRPTARQRFGKHIPAGTNARKIMTSTSRQRISQHVFLTIEAMFSE